jgi:NADPH:quinone reductase
MIMKAIIIAQYGGPEVLEIQERPEPSLDAGQILIDVKAFGLNQAELYFRKGAWGDVAEITGIECVGIVKNDPTDRFAAGQKVMAIVGGMGRSINGSYAELVAVPSSNVAAITSDLSWEALAAIPESYATAWSAITGILEVARGQTVLVRGATSALGQAAINIASHAGAHVIATTRNVAQAGLLETLGAKEILLDASDLSKRVQERHAEGINAVLDIVGNTTILDSLAMLQRGGRACQVGFLGGGEPLNLQPIFQIPSGRFLTVFASALVTGTSSFPMSEIPFQDIVDRVANGSYKAKPAHVFRFDQIQKAHKLLESGQAGGKIVVKV